MTSFQGNKNASSRYFTAPWSSKVFLKTQQRKLDNESSLDSFMLVPNCSILEVTDTLLRIAAPTTGIHNHLLNNDIDYSSIAESSSILMSSSSSSTPAVLATIAATAATSAVMGLIAGYYYRSVASIKNPEVRTLKVPASLLKSPYGEELKLAVQLAMEGTFRTRRNNV